MICSNCGTEMPNNTQYCPFCGLLTVDMLEVPTEPAPFTAEDYAATETGIAVLVCGILGLVFIWVPIVGFVLSISAVALGAKRNRYAPEYRKRALAGFIMGIIGLVPGIIIIIAFITLLF